MQYNVIQRITVEAYIRKKFYNSFWTNNTLSSGQILKNSFHVEEARVITKCSFRRDIGMHSEACPKFFHLKPYKFTVNAETYALLQKYGFTSGFVKHCVMMNLVHF
jgi:hypothetical protein